MDASEFFGLIGGLLGVVIGWFLATRTAKGISREEREERRHSELLDAVVLYWHELERLEDELRQLPSPRSDLHKFDWRRWPLLSVGADALSKLDTVQAVHWLWG